jgi:hypothetical protein
MGTFLRVVGLILGVIVLGFGLVTWWSSGVSLGSALEIAGSSVFTLGIATSPGTGTKSIEIIAAGVGLLVVALEITFDPDPTPTAGTRLTKEEFAHGFERLEEVHFPLERNLDDSGRHFQGWRVNYDSIVDSLTRLIMPPPAPWFLPRPGLGKTEWPGVRNRTPDDPEGARPFRPGITFKTPSVDESTGR